MSAWNVEVLCAKCGGASCFLAGACALEDIRQSSFLFNRSWNHAHYESLSAKVRVAVDTGRYGTAQVADAVNRGLKDAEKWEEKRFRRAQAALNPPTEEE